MTTTRIEWLELKLAEHESRLAKIEGILLAPHPIQEEQADERRFPI